MAKEKKAYKKPELKKNKAIVNVVFATTPPIPNTAVDPGTPATITP